MKKKFFFLSLFAALVFTGCSTDEDGLNGNNGDENKGYGYVAVNIVQPKSIGTRAASDGFEYGSDDENEAQTGLFFIFDDSGNKVGEAQELVLSGSGTSNAPEVERIYKAVLVIEGVETKPTAEKQIVCVLNAPTGLGNETTLSGLEGKIADYATGCTTKGKFIMTNSVYQNGTNKVLGAIIEDSKIVKSAEAALNNPVDIYVERVVAKVRAHSGSFTNTDGAKPTIDGVETPLTIKVTGIEIANIAETSYLFKNITGIDYSWAWDVTNRRSYWETVPTSLTYKNKSYNSIVTDSKPADSNFDINNVSFTEYIQPNTTNQKTSILVTAELNKDGSAIDFVYLRGGYFKPDNALALIATYAANNGYWKKTGENSYSQLATSDFEWKNNEDLATESKISWLKRYEVVARVKDGTTNLFKKVGDTYTDATVNEINELLAGSAESHPYVAQYYNKGKCYYFVNIDQTSVANANKESSATDAAAHTYDGVIRNHIYDLTLNSIKGIGTPVFDPEDVIIPEKPEDETLWYLAARINVLAWKLVNQTIDFN